MNSLSAKKKSIAKLLLVVVVAGGIAATGYLTQDRWRQLFTQRENTGSEEHNLPDESNAEPNKKVLLSDQAIANLGLVARPLLPSTYWKTIQVPGMVVDRPGRSDRSIVSPVTGVVTSIHFFPGDTVRTGEVLFKIRLMSETLHETQSDLFKAIQDIKLAEVQRNRLSTVKDAVPGSRVIEVENQIARLELSVKTYRSELSNRGLSWQQIDDVAQGNFVSEIAVYAPSRSAEVPAMIEESRIRQTSAGSTLKAPTFELQETRVELGQQVEPGQLLCLLANHQSLAIEGRAFRDETSFLEQSVKEGWPVEVDFQENAASGWPELRQEFYIRHLANTIDAVNRTFAFLIPFENESRVVEDGERTQMLWRFRPGQKLRILIRVQKLDNVFVLPSDAVVQDGVDAFVFTQNVNTFQRKPVRVITQDRQKTVLANDSSLMPGSYVVQSAAAQLNRMAKSDNSGIPKGYHIHADGSLHKNEDEGK
jgi:membrane fusion protein, heavy metal efflux system